MKVIYLILLVLVASCSNHDASPSIEVKDTTNFDSLSNVVSNTNDDLQQFSDEFDETIEQVKLRMAVLSSKQKMKEDEILEKTSYVSAMQYQPSDDKDKQIKDLVRQVIAYQQEIAKLKTRIYTDSVAKLKTNKPLQDYVEPAYPRPNDNSLIIKLDKKIKGDGEISDDGIRGVFIMQYGKVAKKIKGYDISCDNKLLNDAKAEQAYYYKGQYFFNDIPPGKYLIKVCAYFGDWKVIKRESGYQEVAMKVSPPIQ